MTLKAEILSRDEIDALMNAVSAQSPSAIRNRAMLGLMYRAEVKVGTLVGLAVRHYDVQSGTLTVPGVRGSQERIVRLDPSAREMLDAWTKVRRDANVRATAPLFCVLDKRTRGRPVLTSYLRGMLAEKARQAGIQKRVSPEGLRQSRAHHRADEAGRFEASIAEYVNADAFRIRYSSAYQKWCDAHHLLETAPDRYATTIGHLCREAIIDFSDDLVRQHEVGQFDAQKTKAKMRAVFAKRAELSGTVRRSLEALVLYWETVSDLVSRQVHSRSLAIEDSRRLVFQTMLVMREVDLALTRMDTGPLRTHDLLRVRTGS